MNRKIESTIHSHSQFPEQTICSAWPRLVCFLSWHMLGLGDQQPLLDLGTESWEKGCGLGSRAEGKLPLLVTLEDFNISKFVFWGGKIVNIFILEKKKGYQNFSHFWNF